MVYRRNAEIKKNSLEICEEERDEREGQEGLYIHWWRMRGTCCKANYSDEFGWKLDACFYLCVSILNNWAFGIIFLWASLKEKQTKRLLKFLFILKVVCILKIFLLFNMLSYVLPKFAKWCNIVDNALV